MKDLIIKTQKELDKVKDEQRIIYIEGGTEFDPLILRVKFEMAYVVVRGQAFVDVGGSAVINDVRDSAVINDVGDSAVIKYVGGSAVINDVRDSAVINDVGDSAVIKYVGGSAVIKYVGGSAVINDVRDSAVINDVGDSAVINELRGEAILCAYNTQKIIVHGYNIIKTNALNKKNLTIVNGKHAHLIVIPEFESTFEDFAMRFKVEVKGKTAILYKSVHKQDGKYLSDYDRDFTYEIGKVSVCDVDPGVMLSCSKGIHIGEKAFAIAFGSGWDDRVILECEVVIKDIVVSKDCDGKVRASKITVVRELPESEYND